MKFLGVDPDLHVLSIAELNDNGTLNGVYVAKHTGFKGLSTVVAILREFQKIYYFSHGVTDTPFVLAVESQDSSYTGRTNAARVQDLVTLAHVSGGVVAHLRATRTYLVKPQRWKGSVPKHIHQKRILRRLGIEYEMRGGKSPYPVPVDFERFVQSGKVNAGDWKDIVDSVGLAAYARDRWMKEEE